MRPLRSALMLTLVLSGVLFAPPAGAQGGPAGTLNGQVIDQSEAPVPGVTVSARHAATADTRMAVTNEQGFYTLSALPVGPYELTFQLEGFKTAVRSNVTVEAAVPRSVNVTLEVGGIAETVTVAAELPVLQTSSAAVARQLSSEELAAVPSSTRNFTHLLTATAGVSADLPPVASNDTGSISPSVNGTKTTSNSVLYNGVDITSLLSNSGSLNENLVPAPETIEEVKLQTSLYDASTGRSGGGNFQLVTKSGANTVNGSFYVFGQHERFNANDFFFEREGIDKPRMRRAEGGFTLGGPLRRDRMFVFGSLQFSDAETGYVPTASSRALLPAALGLIDGDRTADSIVAAFKALNPGFSLTPAQISPLTLALLNARNPRTGNFLIPSPNANGRIVGSDPKVGIGSFGTIGGDPLVELRQVIPAEFQQRQGSVRADTKITDSNRLQVSFFSADFPSLDPFPDPSTMASPWTVRRSNRGHVVSVGNTHVFGSGAVNEARAGFFELRNTRRLDDDFVALTGDQFGIANPALLFDDRDATRRLGHFVNRGIYWSFGGPNDSFNRRDQQTLHFSDAMTWIKGNHTLRVGGDFKQHRVQTNLPEEQATEFEKIENFQQFLLGFTSEADTQFGFTEKDFRANDASWFFADDWRLSERLTVNAGLRWDWYGWPIEQSGFFGNFDPERVTDPSNPMNGLVLPSNAATTGFAAVDAAIAALPRATTKHTLRGQDLNNFAPRIGFAYTPGSDARWAFRGGYGLFYDRPSAAFMNTVFSNYPHLREIEITVPSRLVPIQNAFATQIVNGQAVPFNSYFPFYLAYNAAARSYTLFDGTGIGGTGNIAETLEFRAIDKNLKTPFYQHWNIGHQFEIRKNLVLEMRYNGSKGHNLLLATALNEPWDLNDPRTPLMILDRITAAYRAGGGTASAEDPNAIGYGYINPATGRLDNNVGPNGRVIGAEARTLYLGFNDREAVYLQSRGRSIYHGLQTSLTKRWSQGFELHGAYTYSQSRDLFSSDPGSTAGSARPDEPNSGFAVENDSRDLESNWALSDFDRPHRFSLSAIWELPLGGGALLRNWQVATFMQFQSGRPFSVFAPEAGLISLAFQRLDFAPNATNDSARRHGADEVEQWFDTSQLQRAVAAGNTPRNFLRGPSQKRVDLSIAKRMTVNGRMRAELRAEIFNLFNTTNLGMPVNNIDNVDFGRITTTVGGPRVSQFGLRLLF